MKDQDNPALRDILMQVAELPPERRAAFLDSACGGNGELRAEVESLLRSLEREDELLREPTIAGETLQSGDGNGTSERLGEGPGARIGRYKLLEQIGEGGFGVVFMAEQRDPVRRRVALKIIKLGMDTKQVVTRFEAERQALAMMDHPNIAKVLDGGATESGRPYFVMELVRGVPITAFCNENRLTTRMRLELFIAVCSALQHAHQKGIIHRDLKPGNVLVTMHDDKPVPKIIDFGVAKAINQRLTEHTLFTEFRQFVGTPAYMSPEQAQMSGLDIDTRSDIYSLGVLLYELLTGTTPFESRELLRCAYEEMQRIIREVEPPRPSTRLSTLGAGLRTLAVNMATEPRRLSRIMAGELDWIVMKCLEKDRERRYSTAIGLATDIERHLKGDPVEASPPSVVYRVRKFVRKHDALVGVGVFLLLATSFSTWQALRATRAADAALTQKNRADQQAQVARAQTAEADRQRKEVETQKAQVTQEKIEAQKQEHIASSVNNFLSYMLTRADPDKLMGDKVTVVQAIAAAEKQLDTEIQQGAAGGAAVDPLVEAAIRGTIGNSFAKLGRYDQGERNLRRSLEILRKVTPARYVDLATSESDLATLLAEQNKLEEGEKLQREALDLYRKALPAGHPFIASCLINLGQVLGREGRMKEAESSYREALSIDRKALPAGSPELRSSLSNLGLLLTDLNELDESERLLREALEIDRKSLPAGHPDIATVLNDLASLLARRGNTDDAEATFREALAINRKAYPAGDPALSRNLSDLALLLAGQNKVQEAEAMYREALGIDRKIWPADHPDIARKLNGLATLLSHDGRLEEAEKMYREAIEIDRKSLPADHPDIAIHLDNLTVMLLRQNRVSDAEKLQREALEFDRKSLPPGHPQIASHLTHVAVLLGRQNRPHDAEVLYREALDIERSAPPNAHTDIGVTLNDFAYLLLGQDRLAESEKLFRELVELEHKNHAPATSLAQHLNVLANVLQRENKVGEAEPLMREALALRREAYPSGSTITAGTVTDLALVLQKMNRLAEAESLYREALHTYTSAPKPDDLAIANVSSGLGRTLLRENKYAEAEPFLRNALAIRDRQLSQSNVATVRTASALADLLDRTERRDEADNLRQTHGIKSASTKPANELVSEGK